MESEPSLLEKTEQAFSEDKPESENSTQGTRSIKEQSNLRKESNNSLDNNASSNKSASSNEEHHNIVKTHVSAEEFNGKSNGMALQAGKTALGELDELASEQVNGKCIGWKQVQNKKWTLKGLDFEETILNNQTGHYEKFDYHFLACVFSFAYIGCLFLGGFSWSIIVMVFSVTFYYNQLSRKRRNLKEDENRNIMNERMKEKIESVDWLNLFLSRFWVIYEPELSSTLVNIVDGVLEDFTPTLVDSLTLSTFTLGNKPPIIRDILTHPRVEKNDIMMDWDIEFVPNDVMDMTTKEVKNKINPKIVLEIRVGKGFVAAGIPILVEDIALKSTLRVKITLGEQFPHIDIVSMMFLKPPSIDYVLKPLGGETFGFDIAHIPGLSSLIKDIINSNLQPMMYNPNELILNISEILNSIPTNQIKGILRLKIKNARNLPSVDSFGISDPYMKISLSDRLNVASTKMINNSLNPDWNQDISIVLYDLEDILTFEAMSHSSIKAHKFMASGKYDLKNLPLNTMEENVVIDLERKHKKNQGKLCFDISLVPILEDYDSKDENIMSSPGIVRFTIHQIKELDSKKATLTGKYNLSVEAYFNESLMLQTKIKKRSLNAIYEEFFEFLVSDLQSSMIKLVVKDHKDLAAQSNSIAFWSKNLNEVLNNNSSGGWFNLSDIDKGKVKVSCQFYPLDTTDSGGLNTLSLDNSSILPSIGVVQFHILAASNLVNDKSQGTNIQSNIFIATNPYLVICESGKVKAKTITINNNLNPFWNQVFFLPVYSSNQTFQLRVQNSDSNDKKSFIGYTDFPINQIFKKKEGEDGYEIGKEIEL